MPLFNVIILGAYYYYLTEQNKTYEDSMLDVKNYADSQSIPYRSVPNKTSHTGLYKRNITYRSVQDRTSHTGMYQIKHHTQVCT